MKRAWHPAICLALAAFPMAAEVRLPASLRLTGPLDDAVSSLGDEISNYPFGPGFGAGPIHGWMSLEFNPPKGRIAHFRLIWRAVGDEPVIAFETGHFIRARAVGCFNSGVQSSEGDLNLDTGAVTNFEVHAVFQNLLIDRTSRNNRFPLSSKGARFTVLFGDYPPIEFPFPLSFTERPKTYTEAKFITNAAGDITGFDFRGATFIPLAAVPKVALMPTYSFAPGGDTIVPGADGCFPGTTPADQCLSNERYPDGLRLPDNAFLSPILVVNSKELRDPGAARRPNPPALATGPALGASAAALGSKLFVAGGMDAAGNPLATAAVLDTAANRWSGLPNPPRAAWQACAAATANRLYIIGGMATRGGPAQDRVDAMDASSGAWFSSPPLPVPLVDHGCATLNGRIYVIGGRSAPDGLPSRRAFFFDPVASAWQSLPDLPAPLAGMAVAVNGATLYAVNGSHDGASATNRVFVLDTAAPAWREAPPTGRAVYGASAAFLNSRLHVAGGRTAPAGTLDVGNVHYLTQAMQVLVDQTWYAGLEPPVTVSGAGSALVGDTWYMAGGNTSVDPALVATSAVQAYTSGDGWAISDTHPVFTAESVRNAAALGGGPAELAPGALVSILGYHLAAQARTAPAVRALTGRYLTTDLPTELGGVTVELDDIPAGIVSVAPDRIDFRVPFQLPAGTTGRAVRIQVSRDGVRAPSVVGRLAKSAPGIFVYSHGETRELNHLDGSAAVAFNQDGRLNYGSQPAERGSAVTLRVTGLGDVEPRPEPLQRGPRDPAPSVVNLPEVLIDGRPTVIEWARMAPGEAGIYEIRALVPRDSRTGLRVEVQLRSGSIVSNRAVLAIE